jgi:hypothetical protein
VTTIDLSDDAEHCYRNDCIRSMQCARFMALAQKNQQTHASGWQGAPVKIAEFDPEKCEEFIQWTKS